MLFAAWGDPAPAGGERAFSPAQILNWEPHSFSGQTRFELDRKAGREAVYAVCTAGNASGLFFRGEIDLRQTPIIEWSWYAEPASGGPAETSKSGDDFAARIYVVDEHALLPWRTRALNYVWSSSQPVGADWPNPFASQAHMIAVRSGPAGEGWATEQRNIRDDFRRFHDRDPETIDALAVMTDCDNSGRGHRAWYGRIRLLPE